MEISVFIERNNSTTTITFAGTTLSELLRAININPETVIVVREGEVITEEEILYDKDKVELLSVISGG